MQAAEPGMHPAAHRDPSGRGPAFPIHSPLVDRRSNLGCLFEVVETLVLTLAIFLGVQTFVAQPFQVEGESMQQTLQPAAYLLIDKLSPRWAPYARGEIVVFAPPDDVQRPGGAPFIKRVIGLPGDRVELRDGHVYVNAVALDEPYVYADGGPADTEPGPGGTSSWVVPAGDLFVLGDHRTDSEDSRYFGPIEIGRVVGRAWLRYWPLGAFGILPSASYAVPTPTP